MWFRVNLFLAICFFQIKKIVIVIKQILYIYFIKYIYIYDKIKLPEGKDRKETELNYFLNYENNCKVNCQKEKTERKLN